MPISAPDLTKRPPRSARVRLGGYVILPRMLDKGRATIAGKNGEFHYDCPLDLHFLNWWNFQFALNRVLLKNGKDLAEVVRDANASKPKTSKEAMFKVCVFLRANYRRYQN